MGVQLDVRHGACSWRHSARACLSSESCVGTRAGARPSYSAVMPGVVLRPGEGESLFDGRIVIKANFDELCITESHFDRRPRRSGSRTSTGSTRIRSTSSRAGSQSWSTTRRSCSRGRFRSALARGRARLQDTSPARFLNFHTPDGGFAGNLQARDRGEPGGFDSFDAPPGAAAPGTDAVFLGPGEGERLEGTTRIATIKVGREELAADRVRARAGLRRARPAQPRRPRRLLLRARRRARVLRRRRTLRLGAGSFVAAPIGAVHAFSNPGPDRARLLNIHAPSVGFHEWSADGELNDGRGSSTSRLCRPNTKRNILCALLRTEGIDMRAAVERTSASARWTACRAVARWRSSLRSRTSPELRKSWRRLATTDRSLRLPAG